MGCKPNKKIFINSMEEVKMDEPLPQNEQIQQINQFNIHAASITTQYILFPESTLIEKEVLKDQVEISQIFSFRFLPLSTIQQTLQPFSPDLTPQMLIKCMDSKEAGDQSSMSKNENHKHYEHYEHYDHHHEPHEHDKLQKNKKRLDMKTLEAEF